MIVLDQLKIGADTAEWAGAGLLPVADLVDAEAEPGGEGGLREAGLGTDRGDVEGWRSLALGHDRGL